MNYESNINLKRVNTVSESNKNTSKKTVAGKLKWLVQVHTEKNPDGSGIDIK